MTRARYYLSLLDEHDISDLRRCWLLAVGLAIAWLVLLAFGGCYSVTAPNAATGASLTGTWTGQTWVTIHGGQNYDTLLPLKLVLVQNGSIAIGRVWVSDTGDTSAFSGVRQGMEQGPVSGMDTGKYIGPWWLFLDSVHYRFSIGKPAVVVTNVGTDSLMGYWNDDIPFTAYRQ